MTELNGKNGNGSALKEFFATRERGWAWVTRTVIVAGLSLLGWMAVTIYNAQQQGMVDLRHAIEISNTDIRTTVSDIAREQNRQAVNLTQLTTALGDHVSSTTQQENEIRSEEADHETRIRHLEQTRHN